MSTIEENGLSSFTKAAESAISSIPRGKVATYGQIAAAAGAPRAARQVARLLHARSGAAKLPWHRVLAKGPRQDTGRIALRDEGFFEQALRLKAEGVAVTRDGIVDLTVFGWEIRT
jgi:methylated-DNA-protein-cysteine methyltransferase-like protein